MKPTSKQIKLVLREMNRLSVQGKVKVNGSRHYVCCPFHNEKTPSNLVNLDTNSRFFGCFKCFGCGETGSWNKLAQELGLRTYDSEDGFGYATKHSSDGYEKRLTPKTLKGKKPSKGLTEPMKILGLSKPKRFKGDWRGIPNGLLRKVGALSVIDDRLGNQALYLPVMVGDEEVGGIRALLEPVDDTRVVKYKNSAGEWSKTAGLYPYDYVSTLLDEFEDEYGFRAVCLVEGARDALTLCKGKLPTLGILGTTSWSEAKRNLLLDLDPDYVLLCFDGDAAGRKAEEAIYDDLNDWLPCKKMNLTRFNRVFGYEIDPGNAPKEVIDKIWQTLINRKT